MTQQVYCDVSISLDGFLAGPNDTPANPMGDGGEQIHEWLIPLQNWREKHGLEGGEVNVDDALLGEFLSSVGAVVLGRRMFANGYEAWGDTPPFHAPVFVVTHRPQPPIEMQGGTTYHFVDGGIDDAVRKAKAVAGDMNVGIFGGASIVQQALRAGLIDRLTVHVAPVLLGGGVRLFDDLGAYQPEIIVEKMVVSPSVAHFVVVKK